MCGVMRLVVGPRPNGPLNKCLLAHFAQFVKELVCDGVWWDTISLPTVREPELLRSIGCSNHFAYILRDRPLQISRPLEYQAAQEQRSKRGVSESISGRMGKLGLKFGARR